jgi:hypothetical protein
MVNESGSEARPTLITLLSRTEGCPPFVPGGCGLCRGEGCGTGEEACCRSVGLNAKYGRDLKPCALSKFGIVQVLYGIAQVLHKAESL